MKATAETELAQRFRELLEIPERVNDMGIVETKEMILFCYKTKEGYSQQRWDNITVLDNLLIHYNLKFQGIKLSIEIITNHNFHIAMELLLRGRWEPYTIVNLYEKTLFEWENKGIGDDSEKQIIKQIIYFFNGYEKTESEIQQINFNPQGLQSIYNTDKLDVIFKRLHAKKIVKSCDKAKFVAMFTDRWIDKVYWNNEIRGAKAGLFDLLQRITGQKFTASELKLRFHANVDIHDNWKDKNDKPSKLIDQLLYGL